ncbi:MAG: hydroxysqualene dehydroxylase HpnE [Pseudomonadota bacterium]
MTGTVHIIGAGLAGLSTALNLLDQGVQVRVYEGSGQAGGRCRSYHDSRLDRTIDNGNHLVLSGNTSVKAYRGLAQADPDTMVTAPEATFPFVDLQTDERWTVRMNDGPIPWWPLVKNRRPAGVGLGSMIRAGRILTAGRSDTITDVCGSSGKVRDRFWEPMAMAVVNLPPQRASAQVMRATALEAWRDGRLARPMFAPRGLGAALVDPALTKLEASGCPVQFGQVLRSVDQRDGRITTLRFAKEDVPIGEGDRVVLAVPAHRLAGILPDIDVPTETSSILNAHFLLSDPTILEGKPPLLGVVGSLTQWFFLKGDIVSLTISAAEYVEGSDAQEDALLERLWAETVSALDLPAGAAFSAARLVREKRATFLQTPENIAKRPAQVTRLTNLFLAGDYVDTGLPATIESAVRSGERAARLAA